MDANLTEEQVQAEYDRHDAAFRAAKKRGDYRKASEHKAKRDALSSALDAILARKVAERNRR